MIAMVIYWSCDGVVLCVLSRISGALVVGGCTSLSGKLNLALKDLCTTCMPGCGALVEAGAACVWVCVTNHVVHSKRHEPTPQYGSQLRIVKPQPPLLMVT
jgi:hypothetical protein